MDHVKEEEARPGTRRRPAPAARAPWHRGLRLLSARARRRHCARRRTGRRSPLVTDRGSRSLSFRVLSFWYRVFGLMVTLTVILVSVGGLESTVRLEAWEHVGSRNFILGLRPDSPMFN